MSEDVKATVAQPQASPSRRGSLGLALLPLGVFAALALVFYVGLFRGDPSNLPSALIGKPAPEFDLPALDGLLDRGTPVPGLATSDLRRGRVSIVNVWASWCGPCRLEHPSLLELAKDTSVDLVGINYKDQTSNARRFLGMLENPFKAVGVDQSGTTAIDWGVHGVPETFVVNGSGVIVFKHVGPISPKILSQSILPAIAKAREK